MKKLFLLLFPALLFAQSTYLIQNKKQVWFKTTTEKTHPTFAKYDSSNIKIDVSTTFPELLFFGSDSDNFKITGNTSDAMLFSNASGGYVFDNNISAAKITASDTVITSSAVRTNKIVPGSASYLSFGTPAWFLTRGGKQTNVLADSGTYKFNATGTTGTRIKDSLRVTNGIIFGQYLRSEGGNARGTNAVDLQVYRTAVTQVASGNYSFNSGSANTSSASASTAFGSGNSAIGNYSVALGGDSNTASGSGAVVLAGQANTASGQFSIASGQYAVASRRSEQAFASYRFAAGGDAQSAAFMMGDTTQNLTTTTILTLDGPAHTLYLDVAALTTYVFEALVVGKVISGTDIGLAVSYKLTGTIKRDNANNTTLMAGYTHTVIDEDAAITECDAIASADDTNERLVITVTHATGNVNNLMYWNARLLWVKIGG